MADFHERMRNMVIRQLGMGKGGKGSPLTMTVKGSGVFNPATGKVERQPDTVVTGSAVRVNYKVYSYKDETIQQGDFQLYISPILITGDECPTPVPEQRMTFNNKPVTIVRVEPFNDNTMNCGWKVQARYG
ncbi:hypothetical protein PMW_132 [Pseudomonas phage phiPMW]|uniref:Uncharacterized protein n=1 Tax=Pseudomonas phage phiPMW TaxID=1815582 RepID=A0A1S5R1I3_9CAUD|nr:hypothetical protein FDG97_gp218 [Pseudomonas phage phiPMW]ANA49257.1 hypothetical protein PMW_132 [Pseudomonas phage phiPMW]